MKPYWTILACLCLLYVVSAKRKTSDVAGKRGSQGRTVSDFIDIDAAHEVEFEGSGSDKAVAETDDTDASGDDGDVSSGEELVDRTACQLMREQSVGSTSSSSTARLVGQFVPRCASDGTFERKQCHASTGQCWCVNQLDGQEVAGSRHRAPQTVDCALAGSATVSSSQSPTVAPVKTTTTVTVYSVPSTTRTSQGSFKTRTSSSASPTTRQTMTTPTTTQFVELDNKIPNESDIEVGQAPDFTERPPPVIIEPKSRKLSLRSTIIGQPGILAGIIGAAVTVLLCLVLLVMFIIYRMHRKSQDPAIYYIDKPSRTPAPTTNKKAGYMKALDHDVYT